MLNLIAENNALRLLLLLLLFAGVAAVVFFVAQGFGARQLSRGRLVDATAAGGGAPLLGSLRAERAESAWLKLVNSIEKRGLSLVDEPSDSLAQLEGADHAGNSRSAATA